MVSTSTYHVSLDIFRKWVFPSLTNLCFPFSVIKKAELYWQRYKRIDDSLISGWYYCNINYSISQLFLI